MEDQDVQSPQTFVMKNFFFLLLLGKHDNKRTFKYVLNTDHTFIAACWTIMAMYIYYFEAESDFKSGRQKHQAFSSIIAGKYFGRRKKISCLT